MFTSCFLWKVWPKTRTSPESGTVMPIIMRMLLVFPAPLGPSRPNTFPAGIASDRSSTATNLSNDLRTWISSTVFFMDTLLQFAHYYVRDLPMERHPAEMLRAEILIDPAPHNVSSRVCRIKTDCGCPVFWPRPAHHRFHSCRS